MSYSKKMEDDLFRTMSQTGYSEASWNAAFGAIISALGRDQHGRYADMSDADILSRIEEIKGARLRPLRRWQVTHLGSQLQQLEAAYKKRNGSSGATLGPLTFRF